MGSNIPSYSFRDDYSDGAHPDILSALTNTNNLTQVPYGADELSESARQLIQAKIKNPDSSIHFVASGTLANIIAISASLRSHEAVIAASSGHIVVRETGAIEAVGHKIILVAPVAGKLTCDGIKKALGENAQFPHMARPRMVYISNATEVGTIYSKAELTAISELCKENRLLLFVDGARLGVAMAAGSNDVSWEDLGRLTDIFWIGGTKVGALLGEAIVVNNQAVKEDFEFHVKQRGGLLAKGRVLGLQFRELFSCGDLFYKSAAHANQMAGLLSKGIQEHGFELVDDTVTNQVFPIFPNEVVEKLKSGGFEFYVWEKRGDRSVVRLVTSWSTEREAVEALVKML